MLRILLSALMMAIPGVALADWASGGGELIQDAENPWFVQNTKTVKYCTQYDPDHYHQTPEVTEDLLEKAIAFWKEEFRHGQSIFEPRILVATQDFIKTPCPNGAKDVDIVFQFGFLTNEQQAAIRKPNRYAALAIRTDYDPVNLRGKGFIYVAADSGPLKFSGQNTTEYPWNYGDGGLLYWTLVHELGHVYGLAHTQQRSVAFLEANVMASGFIESIMNRGSSSWFTTKLTVNPIFRVRHRASDSPSWHCGSTNNHGQKLKEFFGVDDSWRCFGIKIMATDLAVFASNQPSDQAQSKLIGRANMSDKSQTFTLISDAIHFWLPPEQKMFPPGARVYTPAHYIEEGVTVYETVSGQIRRQMSFSIDPRKGAPLGDDLKIGGVLNGRLYINLLEGI